MLHILLCVAFARFYFFAIAPAYWTLSSALYFICDRFVLAAVDKLYKLAAFLR